MRDNAFFTALRFYARVLAGVLAATGFLSIIGLNAGWLAPPEPSQPANQNETLTVDSDNPIVAIGPKTLRSQMIPVDSRLTYDLSAEMRSIAPPGMKQAAARTYLGLLTYDKNQKEIRGEPGRYRHIGAHNYYLYNLPNWRRFTGFISGEGDETHNQFTRGTRYVRIVALLNYPTRGAHTESGPMTTEIRNLRFAPRVQMNLKN